MNKDTGKRILKALCIGIAVVLATYSSDGIDYGEDPWVLLAAVCLLSLFNMILKPMLVLFAMPFIVLTLGFGLWIINALLFMLVGVLIPEFQVMSFGSALWGAFLVSIAAMMVDFYLGVGSVRSTAAKPESTFEHRQEKPKPSQRDTSDDDIIDI